MRRTLLLLTTMTIALVLASGVALAAVVAQGFSNYTNIHITDSENAQADPATPYPSEITVSGFNQATILDVNVILNRFRHTFPDDVGVLLEGPTGQKTLLMSDVGSSNSVSGVRVILDDEATESLPDVVEDGPITDGTYKPTRGTSFEFPPNNDGAEVPFNFPSPAPGGPYESSLSVFDGTDPNGIWKLYVLDDSDFDRGRFGGGWRLRISAEVP
jgi:subtilisin-like proprotein convertase family protein